MYSTRVTGYRNVTAAYRVEGFTQDHLDAFQRHGTQRVLIAYDQDDAGDRAAVKLAEKLMARGIACYRIQFPKGLDANAYALKVQPAAKALGLLIPTAEWRGTGPAPEAIPNIQAPVYGFYAGTDARIGATVPATQEQMKAAGKPFETVTYEGAAHGFMRAGAQPDATDANKKARAEAWVKLKALTGKLK